MACLVGRRPRNATLPNNAGIVLPAKRLRIRDGGDVLLRSEGEVVPGSPGLVIRYRGGNIWQIEAGAGAAVALGRAVDADEARVVDAATNGCRTVVVPDAGQVISAETGRHKVAMQPLAFKPLVDESHAVPGDDHPAQVRIETVMLPYCRVEMFAEVCERFLPGIHQRLVRRAHESKLRLRPSHVTQSWPHTPSANGVVSLAVSSPSI